MTRRDAQDALLPARLEVRDLRLVTAVAAEGSLTQAGLRLNVTQPALSRHLSALEQRLGTTLFTRTGTRMLPTPMGELLLRRASDLLEQIASTESELREMLDVPRRSLRVGTDCYTGYHWLPGVLNRYTTRHPDVEVEIAFEAVSTPMKQLRAGTIDVALVTESGKRAGFAVYPLFVDEYIGVVAPGHPLADKSFISPQDLTDQRVLLLSAPGDSMVMQQFVRAHQVKPRLVADVQLVGAVAALAEAEFGVGLVPNWIIVPEVRSGRLVPLRLGRKGFKRTWSAVVAQPQSGEKWLQDFVQALATLGPTSVTAR